MTSIHESSRRTEISSRPQVLVVGAGSAGVAAAVSAAEQGVTTVLAEASSTVGGTLVEQLLESSCGFHTSQGVKIVAGVGQRLLDRLAHYHGTPGHVVDDTGYAGLRAPVNHAELGLVEAQLLAESGVEVVLGATAVGVVRSESGADVVFDGKSGRHAIRARCVVDATGDADIAALSDLPFQTDGTRNKQPASLLFKLGGVDFERLLGFARSNPEGFREGSVIPPAEAQVVHLWGFGSMLSRAYEDGKLSLRRNELHMSGWPSRHEAIVNVTRTSATNLEDCAWSGRALLSLSQQVLEFADFFRQYVPGCAASYVAGVASRVGIRESRRVRGVYTITEHDVKAGARFADAIGKGGFPIDVHDNKGIGLSHTAMLAGSFDIPYRSQVPVGSTNVIVAGRGISSTHVANGSLRQTAQCFVTGESAGVAAAIASEQGRDLSSVDTDELRGRLRGRGVLL